MHFGGLSFHCNSLVLGTLALGFWYVFLLALRSILMLGKWRLNQALREPISRSLKNTIHHLLPLILPSCEGSPHQLLVCYFSCSWDHFDATILIFDQALEGSHFRSHFIFFLHFRFWNRQVGCFLFCISCLFGIWLWVWDCYLHTFKYN